MDASIKSREQQREGEGHYVDVFMLSPRPAEIAEGSRTSLNCRFVAGEIVQEQGGRVMEQLGCLLSGVLVGPAAKDRFNNAAALPSSLLGTTNRLVQEARASKNEPLHVFLRALATGRRDDIDDRYPTGVDLLPAETKQMLGVQTLADVIRKVYDPDFLGVTQATLSVVALANQLPENVRFLASDVGVAGSPYERLEVDARNIGEAFAEPLRNVGRSYDNEDDENILVITGHDADNFTADQPTAKLGRVQDSNNPTKKQLKLHYAFQSTNTQSVASIAPVLAASNVHRDVETVREEKAGDDFLPEPEAYDTVARHREQMQDAAGELLESIERQHGQGVLDGPDATATLLADRDVRAELASELPCTNTHPNPLHDPLGVCVPVHEHVCMLPCHFTKLWHQHL